MNNFDIILEEKIKSVNEIIIKYLPKEEGFQKKVIEAMKSYFALDVKREKYAESYYCFSAYGTSACTEL